MARPADPRRGRADGGNVGDGVQERPVLHNVSFASRSLLAAERPRAARAGRGARCIVALPFHRDTSVSRTPVTVEYGPQLVSGSALFLAFKLGVTEIYSKTLPTVALQKTSTQRATEEGGLLEPLD